MRMATCALAVLALMGCQHHPRAASIGPLSLPRDIKREWIAFALASAKVPGISMTRHPLLLAETRLLTPEGMSWRCYWKDGVLSAYRIDYDFNGLPFSYPGEVVRRRGQAAPDEWLQADLDAVTSAWEITEDWRSIERSKGFARVHPWETYHFALLCEEKERFALLVQFSPANLVGSGHLVVLECDGQRCKVVHHERVWIA